MNAFITACKRIWKAITQPNRVYTHTYTIINGKVQDESSSPEDKEIWDRIDKAFKKADEAFKMADEAFEEAGKAFDNIKKK